MGKILGGSQTSQTTIPKYMQDASQAAIAEGNRVAGIGYTPYYGADVAAFNPTQEAAFGNTNAMAQAFGMQAAPNSMPKAQTFAGGVRGYSSAPMYQEAIDALKVKNPTQYNAIRGIFEAAKTGGQAETQAAAQEAATKARQAEVLRMYPAAFIPGSTGHNLYMGAMQEGQGTSMPAPSGNPSAWDGLRDMINGGGAGASGGAYSGGGLLSSIANRLGSR